MQGHHSLCLLNKISGSAGINLALIAAGNADAYAQVGKSLLEGITWWGLGSTFTKSFYHVHNV